MIFVAKNVLQKFLFKNLSNIIFGQKTSCPKKMSWGKARNIAYLSPAKLGITFLLTKLDSERLSGWGGGWGNARSKANLSPA